jgi:peptide/nickel transport system permease protein
MGRYIIRRLLQAVLLLFLLSIFLFVMLHLLPGGPQQVLFNPRLSKAARAALAAKYGVDKPLPVQYLFYMQHLLQGDLTSFGTGQPVFSEIGDRLPYTLQLFAAALGFALVVALLLGVIAAVRQYSVTDYTVTVLSYFGIAMPVFFFALILQKLFGVILRPYFNSLGFNWPIFGLTAVDTTGFTPLDYITSRLFHLILPTLVLSLLFIAQWSRYLRSSMLDTVKQDYIRTARAKGLGGSAVFFRHALRNALIPFVTVVALDFAGFAGGAVITETKFALPGIGKLFFDSLSLRDYPILLTMLLFAAMVVVLFNLIADLLYGVLDPRISYS